MDNGHPHGGRCPGDNSRTDTIDRICQIGLGLRLIYGRVGRGIYDEISSGFDNYILDARRIGEVKLRAT
jgi:hypothetical protein